MKGTIIILKKRYGKQNIFLLQFAYNQELLGHSRPETTMIYTHVKKKSLLNIESPLDKLVKGLMDDNKEEQKVMLSRKFNS